MLPGIFFPVIRLFPNASGVSGSVIANQAWALQVARNGGGNGFCPDVDVGGPEFVMTSNQTLDYDILDPLTGSLSASTVALGDSITFTVTPGPGVVVDTWAWQFVQGNTSSIPGHKLAPFTPNECGSTAGACTFAPMKSGRIWVQAQLQELNGRFAFEPSGVITVGDSVPGDSTVAVTVTAGSTSIAPRLRRATVRGIVADAGAPGRSPIQVTVTLGGDPADNANVEVRGEYVGDSAHAHVSEPIRFEQARTVSRDGVADKGRPVTGYFVIGTDTMSTHSETTDSSGLVAIDYIAGHVSGTMHIIAEASVGDSTAVDTVKLTVGLDPLSSALGTSKALLIGHNQYHPVDTNWFLQADLLDEIQTVADSVQRVEGGITYNIQLNDMSLELGGAFNFDSLVAGVADDPYVSHQAHKRGIDVDVSACLSSGFGIDTGAGERVFAGDPITCTGGVKIDVDDLEDAVEAVGGVVFPEGNHYHIRFTT